MQQQQVIISNRYRILQNLGEGGFGQTYLAEDLHLPTKPHCVVKRLQPQNDDEETVKLARRLFEQEAEVLYRLGNHSQIPSILAHFEEAGEFYLVQELIEGETLAQEFERCGKYNEPRAIDLLKQILETLAFVHGQNVIHRDIKPTNLIRRASDGKIFLIDFGAVKQVSVNPFNNKASFHSTVAIGSAGYTPGEQAAGKPCFASDLYAVGLVAIEALTTLHPLNLSQNRNTGEFVWQHKANLNPDVMNFIAKLVRYDYRQRFPSAKEAFAVLNSISSSLGFGRKMQNHVEPKVVQPVQVYAHQPMPLPVQVVQSPQQQFYPPTVPPTQKAANVNQNIPATIVYSPSPKQNYQTNYQKQEGKWFFGWIWNNDLALAFVVTGLVIGFFLVVGYVLIASAVKNAEAEARKSKAQEQSSLPNVTDLSQTKTVSAYQEALEQAGEAEKIEKKATTKFEWEEIGNKYKRAAMLLESINQDSPDYANALAKNAEFKKRSESAFVKAKEIQNNPQLAASANTNSTQTTMPTSYAPQPQSYSSASTTSTTPYKKAKMPATRGGRKYIAYSSSTGDYIGGGQDKVFTDNDGNISARVNNNHIEIRFSGGSDWWTLDLAAPQNMKLVAGSYGGAQRHPFQSPTRPGLDFSGSGRGCNKLSGSFQINNIQYGYDDTTVLYLDATFVQNCEEIGAPLMGRVHYDAR